jgi:hypothetical protein
MKMETYKKPRRRSYRSRMQKTIAVTKTQNHKEWMAITMQSSEVEARARIQSQFPDETPEEQESRLLFVMRKGAQPTTAAVQTPGTIPKEVRKARKAERKRKVKANRPRRQAEERFRKAMKALRDEGKW